jgi:hypothetical protein
MIESHNCGSANDVHNIDKEYFTRLDRIKQFIAAQKKYQ